MLHLSAKIDYFVGELAGQVPTELCSKHGKKSRVETVLSLISSFNGCLCTQYVRNISF